MNIQRYKWPVMVAASLHGALFLSTPQPGAFHDKTTRTKLVGPPPVLEDRIIEVAQPEADPTNRTPTSGGPAVPELPEVITAFPDKVDFATPVVDHPRTERVATTLEGISGAVGPDTGAIPTAGIPLVDFRKLDHQPRATAQIAPEYPATMHQQSIEGSVTVEFDVNTEGKVVRAEAVQYTRSKFTKPALRAVQDWHFEPGKRGGHPVPFRMAVPIEFRLGD